APVGPLDAVVLVPCDARPSKQRPPRLTLELSQPGASCHYPWPEARLAINSLHMEITLRVPATSANLGPGFDCLGLALDIWATVHVSTVRQPPRPENPIARLVHQGIKATYEGIGPPPLLAIDWDRAIPLARGLGASARLRAA